MSLPDGVTTCLLTYGPITDTFGNLADSITVEVVADRTIVHAASGRTMFDVPVSATADMGGVVQIAVPHTDQSGFRDKQQNSLTGWYYTITLTARFANGPKSDRKVFQPVIGQTTVDLDLIQSDGMVTPGVTAPTASVTSVAGKTGEVSAEDLADGLSGTFASLNEDGELVVNGVVVETGSDLAGTTPVSARIDIVTAGKAEIVSKVTYLNATLAISGVPGIEDYAGVFQIRLAGNYTATLPKKPYKLKMPAKVSLMGMPAFDDWRLLANHTDPSKINTALAFEIGQDSDGLDWTPRSEFAQVYLNGTYAGLYQLCETSKRGTDRINVDKAGTTGLALTGGYLLEVANREANDGVTPGFITTQGVGVIYDDPDGANTTQATYIRGQVQAFEDALYNDTTWLDPATGYARYIDRDSFIDWYLIQELASNQDSDFTSSCKLYRTRDTDTVPGRFYMGPLWDFDVAFGSVVNISHASDAFYTLLGATWFQRLVTDPTFANALGTRWAALKARLIAPATGVNATIDRLSAQVASAALPDQDRWDYDADWAALAAFKKTWLGERVTWMSGQFTTPGAPTTLAAGTPGAMSVPLTWTAPTGTVPGSYQIGYRVAGTSPWTIVQRGAGTATVISGLAGTTAYEFVVRGVTLGGPGPWSNAATATTATPAAPGALVADNFNRADDPASLGVTSTGAVAWEPLVGTWGVVGNQAAATATTGNAIVLVPTGSPNGTVKGSLITNGEAGGVSLVLRVTSPDDFYLLNYRPDGTLFFRRASVPLFETNLSGFRSGPITSLAVKADGSNFVIYANDFEVTTLSDSSYPTGKWGIRTDYTATRVDDFSVTPL